MRVLILDRALENPYSLGLADGLRRRGLQVVVAGPLDGRHRGVEPVYPRAAAVRGRAAKATEVVGGTLGYLRLLRRFAPDIVHFQWLTPPDLLYLRLTRRFASAATALTVHDPAPRRGGETEGWRRSFRLLTAGLQEADLLVTHSHAAREALVDRYDGRLRRPVAVVGHGNYAHVADPLERREARRRLRLPADRPVFAFFGQLRPHKGVDTLLRAHVHLEGKQSSVLVVAGTAVDQDYYASLRRLAAELSLTPTWLVSPHHLPQKLLDVAVGAATQVVLPFHGASQSGSVIMAMTLGRCVVSTDVGDIPRTVAETGLLVPPGDETALAAAMGVAIDDPAHCEALGQEARRRALEALDWSCVVEPLIAAYRDVAAKR